MGLLPGIMKKYFIILILISSLYAVGVGAVGVGVKPSYLELTLPAGQVAEAKLNIYNVSLEPAQFKIYPDELKDWIKVEPADFRLEASEVKAVKIYITAKEDGKQATNLSVVATPLDKRQFNADSGIKVPVRLNISPGATRLWENIFVFMVLWYLLCLAIICLVVIIVIKLRKPTLIQRLARRFKKILNLK